VERNHISQHEVSDAERSVADEGGLRPPPGLSFWRRVWWWFYFLILVKIARLRFVAILLVIGIIITQWKLLEAYYDKWTRPAGAAAAGSGEFEYFCPMHPSIIRDNPKDECPICFMPLSRRKKRAATEEALPAGVVNRVQLSPYRVVLAGVQTWEVEFVPLTKRITAVGTIEFNERGQRTVSARVKGRIDRLLVNETGQMVAEGDVLAEVYSPDLVVTMQNLLQAHKSGNRDLLQIARTRLELLGISADQIDEVLANGKATTHLEIRSPISGHVIKKLVREGDYVEEGMPLYEVADLSSVWILASVFEDDLIFLPTAQDHPDAEGRTAPEVVATTRALPHEEFRGRLSFIYPHVDEETRTIAVRFEMDNPQHKLRPGSTATVTLELAPRDLPALAAAASQAAAGEDGKVLAIPESAVIHTGAQAIVYRQAAPGVFEGVVVELGPKMTNSEGVPFYPVLRGLARGDRIVTSGSFLVDAETRLNPAAGSIYFGGSGGTSAGGSKVTTVRPSTPEDEDAKIAASLARLSPADRKLAEEQRYCVTNDQSRLGSMGTPVKLLIEGQTVFVCCEGCTDVARTEPQKTLARLHELRKRSKK
jgi:Cu(I)/Ag(I) efflux system membrane fusion protein